MAYFPVNVLDNAIKAMPTVKAISNTPIATFTTDIADRLVSCVCDIPSGKSVINVVACGKNLFDVQNAPIINGTIGATSYSYNSASGSYVVPIPKGNYKVYISNPSTTICRCCTINQYPTGTSFNISNNNFNAVNATSATFTVNNTSDSWLVIQTNRATIDARSSDIQVELGNTATTYESYNGNTYNIQLGETLTDTATYDAISGVLTRNDTTTKQLDSCNIVALDNDINNIWCDTGDIIDLKYISSVGQAIS